MPTIDLMLRSALAVVILTTTMARARAEEPTVQKRQCFSTGQTRRTIEENGLIDPFVSMRAAAQDHQGEALGARLCRQEESFIYEISLLQNNGRIVRILFDARTGKPHYDHADR